MSVPIKICGSSTLRYVILWSTKIIKSTFKIFLPICEINFRVQHLSYSLIYHRVTIHHDIFLKPVLSEFPHRIIHQSLVHFFIPNLLFSKFIKAGHADEGIWAKNNLLVLCDVVFDGFFTLFICFHSVSMGYI